MQAHGATAELARIPTGSTRNVVRQGSKNFAGSRQIESKMPDFVTSYMDITEKQYASDVDIANLLDQSRQRHAALLSTLYVQVSFVFFYWALLSTCRSDFLLNGCYRRIAPH